MKTTLKQNAYGTVEILKDNDIIEITCIQADGSGRSYDVIQIEVENVDWLIKQLQLLSV